eukprot:4559127-Amphidinium_carterae.1
MVLVVRNVFSDIRACLTQQRHSLRCIIQHHINGAMLGVIIDSFAQGHTLRVGSLGFVHAIPGAKAHSPKR